MTDVPGILCEESTHLENTCRLDFTRRATHHRLTTIICTIGAGSRNVNTLKRMIMNGMRIARLNLSHDSLEFHAETMRLIREASEAASKELGYLVQAAIALDTKGPEIRTGLLEGNPNLEVEIKANDNLRLSINRDLMDKGNRECIYVDYPNIINVVQPGMLVFVNDGSLKLIVKEVGVDCITCQVERGGMLGSHKKVNLPGATVDLPAVSEKDINDLKFGVENNIDMIFASSMRSEDAVNELRDVLKEKGREIKIISKIDCLQGLESIDKILNASDGILFSRNDVAIEIPSAKVFLAQKAVLARCNRAGKPVIVASELLESMRHRLRPSRAEICDLGNAILDGADCVMLSSETAVGRYPVQSVQMLANVAQEAESALWYKNIFQDLLDRNPSSIDAAHSVAIAAVDASRKTLASAIIVLTTSGRSAHLMARYKPRCPVLAVTRCNRSFRQCFLYRGIVPILYSELPNTNWLADIDARIQYAMNIAKRINIIKTGDTVVIVSPWKDGSGFTNTMRLVYAFYEQEDFDCIFKTDQKATKKIYQ
uniref:Pyruvate kinase n=1 Tax=Glossina austeni TaxID=7395 RepID=A0A1A9VKP6_GLOAU